ncbi:hypothetical protein F511_09535 [Dorcoceras hygrometricum]|uniref:DUF4378 domain-containing protein n=1 Tax=Dorcoceras hygrometricum TaxID=472368 RepID=A0A2Z7CWB5_9LAMI|nr:hypothetical protein F511_09535 [Dorcoceras hygrometricum]
MLHELLKQEQEPFHLKTYIAEKCCQLQKPTPEATLQLRNICKKVCFSSSEDAQYVKKPAFLQILPTVNNSCKCPPILVEGKAKNKSQLKNDRLGLFGYVMKRFHDGDDNKMSASSDVLIGDGAKDETICEENVRKSCSWRNVNGSVYRLESNEEKSTGWEASTCSYRSKESESSGEFTYPEMRSCPSSFRFSMGNSPPSSGFRTPDFCTPVASPSRHPEKEKENCCGKKVSKKGENEEMKQYSPLSVLEPCFEDLEDNHGSEDAEESYDFESRYANVQRARQQLLYRLQRFEKLAELDPNNLERQLPEDCDNKNGDNYQRETDEWLDDVPLSTYRENHSSTKSTCKESSKPSIDTKKLMIEEKNVMILEICSNLDSLKDTKFEVIYGMILSEINMDFDGWKEYIEEEHETAAEVEIEIFDMLMEQLLEEVQECTGQSFKVLHHV